MTNGKASMHVTVDVDILETIERERGELISRSKYANFLLKKGIATLKKERGETDEESG